MFLLIKGTEEKINICNNNKEGLEGGWEGYYGRIMDYCCGDCDWK
jgi:hypothetical protein